MTHTIIGVFDSFAQAEAAKSRLEADGVAAANMAVHAQDAGFGTSAATDTGLGTTPVPAADATGHEHEGAMSRIEHFFKRLFGDDDRPEEAGHYQEAVRRGGALLSVEVNDESSVERVQEALYAAGAVDIDSRVAQWRGAGYTGYDRNAPAYTSDEIAAERQAFPVVQESLEVGKREVSTGGVRVYSRVTETPVSEAVTLREEHATIERRAVDRPATTADLTESSVEVRETAEQAVVAKTARVVEEVVVGKESSSRTETVNDTVRGTEVEVERVEGTDKTARLDEVGKKPI
ncbi:Stress response protein YsnF [Paraburkholderia kirstenboschensis]|uniref:YsnF/AvaK domain-containing protein n=1 Tax=Paraburkholderia kirstenboschensis TaxID=1245436 RepID=UPI000A6C4E2C|nr:YsnF/AvaK domain-containing protein [Paraburkholderia kirstenboschensis]CAD6552826.1 Stress response protein YsnF [Paraburkholderia kirstenboschensis]